MEDQIGVVSEDISRLITQQNEIIKILDSIKRTMQNMSEFDKLVISKLMDLDKIISNVYDSDIA
jgi:hypothetical protein|tara:strand:+ start:258 stop:449 length:192 start_codon:yes stop_codon:yes gene_type:complete